MRKAPLHIQGVDPEKFYRAYGIQCQQVYPWEGVSETPFFTAWGVVPPGGTARAHKHQEHESFVIVQGRGRMRVDDQSREVGPGDVILMEPFAEHELTNLSQSDELLFLDLCWEDMEQAVRRNRAALASDEQAARVLVTATPPTPNGDLHVGHLSGPYLGADIFTRYCRQRGREAAYLSGADDHQSYTETKGAVLGQTPRQVADRFGDAIVETLRQADIEISHFARPLTSTHHRALTAEVFARLVDRGAIVKRQAPTLYCVPCERFLFEAHVVGSCPHCGASSNGNACEACGRPNDSAELHDPSCKRCGGEPELRPQERFFFPLAPFAERLERYWDGVQMGAHLRSLCDVMLSDGLPDIAVSQQSDWGIPVPVEGFEDQAIYVWFEMAPGYLAATRELGEQAEDAFWRSAEAEVVQFFGFDNGYFHAVLFPAIFMAFDDSLRLPTTFVTNEFYRYEGEKFSTSRNHAMWARELLAEVPVDVARYCLAFDGPEREQSNFTLAGLRETARRELMDGWERWLRSLGRKLAQVEGVVPSTGGWTAEQQSFFQSLIDLSADAAEAYEAASFSPQRAARVLSEVVREAHRFGSGQEHWRALPGRYEEWRTALALEVLAAKTLALLAAPLMPRFSARLLSALGREGSPVWDEIPRFLPGGSSVGSLDVAWFSPVATPRFAAV
ncbi:MAG: class I tRNA ligase family protein [Acidobacteriota bacterium]